jgi:hypothetical protein
MVALEVRAARQKRHTRRAEAANEVGRPSEIIAFYHRRRVYDR